MNDSKSRDVESSLAKPDIHQQWIETYYQDENEAISERVIDRILGILNPPAESIFLDAGCGICADAILVAERGFTVQAIDFSEAVLEIARKNVKANGLDDKISIRRADILALPFEDETFSHLLCLGVLMHIPALEVAISELIRVLRPGGALVISENNMYSLQSLALRSLRRLTGKQKRDAERTSAGMEYWETTSAGPLLTRQTDIRWLIGRFKTDGFTVKKRIASQFTDIHIPLSSQLLKNLIHGLNNVWFKYIGLPRLALGNIVIVEKAD